MNLTILMNPHRLEDQADLAEVAAFIDGRAQPPYTWLGEVALLLTMDHALWLIKGCNGNFFADLQVLGVNAKRPQSKGDRGEPRGEGEYHFEEEMACDAGNAINDRQDEVASEQALAAIVANADGDGQVDAFTCRPCNSGEYGVAPALANEIIAEDVEEEEIEPARPGNQPA